MGSHWYASGPNGPQRYKQYCKDGSERVNILRGKALADGAVEGVTSLLKIVGDAGGLIHWAANHGINAGLDVGMSAAANMEPRDALYALAKAQWKEATERAANEGTVIHDSIEKRLTEGDVSDDPVQKQAQDDAEEWVKANASGERRAEHCLIYKGVVDGVRLAFGGTCDLITPFQIIDYKTVESGARGFRDPKPSEAAQLAAYRLAGAQMGLCEPLSDCWNVFYDRKTGRLVKAHRWTDTALKHGLTLLCLAVRVSEMFEKIEATVERAKK